MGDRLEEERRAAEGCTFRPAITAFAHALPGDHVVPPRPLPPPPTPLPARWRAGRTSPVMPPPPSRRRCR